MTYDIAKNKDGIWTYKSKKYLVTATKAKGHVYVIVSSSANYKYWKRKGLTAIHDKVSDFEMRVILIHFAKQARDYGKNMPTLKYVNYAHIFGSCFE